MRKEKKQAIFFKAIGSNSIGLGHIRRCIALIQTLPSNLKGIFITDQEELTNDIIIQYGIEICNTEEFFNKKEIDVKVLIYDEIGEDRVFLKQVRKKFQCTIVALDYFNYNNPLVDIIVNLFNQNTTASPSTSNLLKYHEGLQFSIINSQFNKKRNENREIKTQVENVLIVMGGSDPNARTIDVIRFLAEQVLHPDLHINVVIGPLCSHKDAIQIESALLTNKVTVYHSPSFLPQLMAEADLALSGCATTFFELSFLGTPAIIFSQNEFEHRFCEYLRSQNVALYEGNDLTNTWEVLQLVSVRKVLSQKQKKVFDGKGAKRILSFSGIE
jgi:UDP-2,4-diacetamido-2,4,6-trideoxy-beta-L-altropyranose hydrolase